MGQHVYKDKQMVDLDQSMGYIQVDKQVTSPAPPTWTPPTYNTWTPEW